MNLQLSAILCNDIIACKNNSLIPSRTLATDTKLTGKRPMTLKWTQAER